jgi:hypothetical protein
MRTGHACSAGASWGHARAWQVCSIATPAGPGLPLHVGDHGRVAVAERRELSCAMGLDEQTTDELRATLRQLTAAVNAVAS